MAKNDPLAKTITKVWRVLWGGKKEKELRPFQIVWEREQ